MTILGDQERQVPPFLFIDVSGSSSDQKRLLMDLQRFILWKVVNSDKPYDGAEALDLQRRLWLAYQNRLRVEAIERSEALSKAEHDYGQLCSRLAEATFDVELEIEDLGTRRIGWHDKIVDEVTKKSVGSPSQLFNGQVDGSVNMAWHHVEGNVDARVDLTDFLARLRRKYDGFDYSFSFDRHVLKPRKLPFLTLERAPFKPEMPRFFAFTLRLVWKPIEDVEVAKKLETIVQSHGRIAVQHQQSAVSTKLQ